MATTADTVRGTFKTDPISALGLPLLISSPVTASVGVATDAAEHHGHCYVLSVDEGQSRGITNQREVLMKFVVGDVKYNSDVTEYVSRIPVTLTATERISRAIKPMIVEVTDNISIVDGESRATARLRSVDVIQFLAEAFPEQLGNLPPDPHQTLSKPEGG